MGDHHRRTVQGSHPPHPHLSRNNSLRTWTHDAKPYLIPKGITQANLSRLEMVAACFHDAAYIYLHSTLERISQQQQQQQQPPLPSSWAALVHLPKTEAVHRFLNRVKSVPLLASHCEYSALTFPLFIAGCESDIAAERAIVMLSLDRLQENYGIGNVQRAKELLVTLWRRSRRQHWMDALDRLQWELMLV